MQMIRSAQHGGVACYSAEPRLRSDVLQHLEFGGRGQRGGIFSCALFFWADGARGNTDALVGGGGGASTEIKKESSFIQPQPTCVGTWKERCTENIQEVAI